MLLIITFIMALFEMIGILSILPFIGVLTNPDLINNNIFLNEIYIFVSKYGINTNNEFLFFLGLCFLLLLIISLLIKALTIYYQSWFITNSEYFIGRELFEKYMSQPYLWFLNNNSIDLAKNILSEVLIITSQGLRSSVQLITSGLVIVLISLLLAFVNIKITLITFFMFSMLYFFIYRVTRNLLDNIGKQRIKENEKRFTKLNNSFLSIKEVKLRNSEQLCIDEFSSPAKNFAKYQINAEVIGSLPRFAVEAIIFGGAIMLILYLMKLTGNLTNSLPLIALFVFAGYRMMPAFQQIYAGFSKLRYVDSAINILYRDLKNLKKNNSKQNHIFLPFNKEIILENVIYKYPRLSSNTLNNININIPAGSTFGIAGSTGSGKTTLVDLLTGLIYPKEGFVKVDGVVINEDNVRAWQKSIGYVPQDIFLLDDTIAANIAFGVKFDEINQKAIEKASKIANLHDFVQNELPSKYQTKIGENGKRLSGGQRQRIGIARALYHSPKVLVLDEATSALDTYTQEKVTEAINELKNKITIIIIAHRLNTLKKCDKICLLEQGQVKAQGKFNDIFKSNEIYKNLNK